jgi:voltage-gated potassium channel Kch
MQAQRQAQGGPSPRKGLNAFIVRHKYTLTLVLMLLVHVCLAAVEDHHSALFSPLFILSLDFLVFIYLLLREGSTLSRWVLTTGAAAMGLSALSLFAGGTAAVVGGMALHGAFLLLIILLTLGQLTRERKVSIDTVMAGVIVYLVMAAFWTQIYAIMLLLDPGALRVAGGLGPHPYTTLYYFSMATLTTAGFGDIVPVSDLARILTVYEALVGQIYLVVFIALLMGRHFANR